MLNQPLPRSSSAAFLPPPPPPHLRSPSHIPSVPVDIFESVPVSNSNEQPALVYAQAQEIARLQEQNAQLLLTIEELRRQLNTYETDANGPKESAETLNAARLDVLRELSSVEEALDAHHHTHTSLIERSQDSLAIDAYIKETTPKPTKLSAKMALQKSAKDFEETQITPLNLRHAELLKSLTKATVRYTRATPSKELMNESIVSGLEAFLGQAQNKVIARQIKDAVNTQPGQRAHDIKPILNAILLRFLEALKPEEFTAKEWANYLGSAATNSDCAAILLHFGIDSLDRLTSAAEQHLIKLWKEEAKRLF